jgi:hypothetical protein
MTSDTFRFRGWRAGHIARMDAMDPLEPPVDPGVSTDAVLSESVERVRSSRQLLDEIDQRLRRGEQLLSDDAGSEPSA